MQIEKLKILALSLLLALPAGIAAQKQGTASFYGNKFHGRRTSDGSLYHRDSLTCAHRTLPFGTLLRVRNLSNNREVIVKVNDRGPFHKGRIVDLSRAAAEQLGFLAQGTARVELTQVTPEELSGKKKSTLPDLQLPDPATGQYYSLSEWQERDAEAKAQASKEAADKQRAAYIEKVKRSQPRWRVLGDIMTALSAKP